MNQHCATRAVAQKLSMSFFDCVTTSCIATINPKDILCRRLLKNRGWEFYNGYNVTFRPQGMSADDLLQAHRTLWRTAFSTRYVVKRIARSVRRLRLGALLLSLAMNGFYGLKSLRGNLPIDMGHRIVERKEQRAKPAVDTKGAEPCTTC